MRHYTCHLPTRPRPARPGEPLLAMLATTPGAELGHCPGWARVQRERRGDVDVWSYSRLCDGSEPPTMAWACEGGRVLRAAVLAIELTDPAAHAADPMQGIAVAGEWRAEWDAAGWEA